MQIHFHTYPNLQHKIIGGLVLLISFAISPCYATNWKKLAMLDLKSMHTYLQNDSAGGADTQNIAFTHWLNTGYQQAENKVAQVNSPSSYTLLMNQYANGFHDEHVQYVPFLRRFNFTQYWPGFTVYYLQKKFYVSSAARNKIDGHIPPARAQLISCDKVPVKQLMQRQVFPYFGNPTLEASWHIMAPRLFFYSPNPWFAQFKQCTFKVGKKKLSFALHYHPISKPKARHLRLQTNYPHHGKFAARRFAKDNIWISLPSFLPQSTSALRNIKALLKQAPSWRNQQRIVLDLRGNLGGNSIWGTRLLEALYGKAYLQQQLQNLAVPIYAWRASQTNLQELQDFYTRYVRKHFGSQSDAYQQLQATIQGIKQALKNDQPYYQIPTENTKHSTEQLKNPVKAKIYWLTDGRCASSCLTFGDELFTLPNVTQIGQTTHADTAYTESVVVKLPSGARLYYPMKMQHNRTRGNNQPYVPQIIYTHDINNTQKIQHWLTTIP